jgi:hypothetical protein
MLAIHSSHEILELMSFSTRRTELQPFPVLGEGIPDVFSGDQFQTYKELETAFLAGLGEVIRQARERGHLKDEPSIPMNSALDDISKALTPTPRLEADEILNDMTERLHLLWGQDQANIIKHLPSDVELQLLPEQPAQYYIGY